jgi:hypothetical protein
VVVVDGRVAAVVDGGAVVIVDTAATSMCGDDALHAAAASAATVKAVRIAMAALVLLTACASDRTTPSTTTAAPTTTSTTVAITTTTARATTATSTASWRPGCPVPLSQLRVVSVRYWGFDDAEHAGTVVVNQRVAAGVERVFANLLRERFPIRRVEPIDNYGGDDERSLEADNTAGFNCRRVVGGSGGWSKHAYGLAIDVDPIENPYLEHGNVHPQAGREYLDRSNVRPGMATEGGALVKAFAAEGWSWGGRWSGTPDYQHFQIS